MFLAFSSSLTVRLKNIVFVPSSTFQGNVVTLREHKGTLTEGEGSVYLFVLTSLDQLLLILKILLTFIQNKLS